MDVFGNFVIENFVEYHIFSNCTDGTVKQQEELLKEIESYIKPYLTNYIFQKERFKLQVWNNNTTQSKQGNKKKDPLHKAPLHLYNILHFGDCIDDEWFVVFLLVQLSKSSLQEKYNLIITIKDNDGEFLLIEAANQLPKWISKPKHAINRVFIYKGDLHLLPRCLTINDPSSFGYNQESFYNDSSSFPSINESIEYLTNNYRSTKSNENIQESAFSKIETFNEKLSKWENKELDSLQEQHFACVFIPYCIYLLLQNNNSNILSKAINTLCKLDFNPQLLQIDPKYKKVPRICSIHPNIEQQKVWHRIRFSKWLYAQLNFFNLPFNKITNEEEEELMKNFTKSEVNGILLGRKLEFGFSLLYHNSKNIKNEKLRKDFDFIKNCKEFKWEDSNLLSRSNFPDDDNDSWLQVSPDEIESILKNQNDLNGNQNPKEQMDDLLKEVDQFMGKNSGFEGIDDDSSSGTDDEFYSDGEEDEEMKILMEQMDAEVNSLRNLEGNEDDEFMKHYLSSLEENPGMPNPFVNFLKMIPKKK